VTRDALIQAIRLNGAGVDENLAAFDLGCAYAHDAKRFASVVPARSRPRERPLDDLIAHRSGLLTAYQNEAYATQYRDLIAYVRAKETAAGLGEALTRAVAVNAYKLMAYKDEYEVARLYTNGDWKKSLRAAFAGDLAVHFHLAPPLLARKGADGRPKKMKFDYWMYYALKALTAFKGLRGTAFDPFAHTEDRKLERALRDDYFVSARDLAGTLSPATHDLAVRLAALPDLIRGYGPVKRAGVERARTEEKRLRAAMDAAATAPPPAKAAE
jgi:indolepyruvate ferredoxin oxidoreductase